MIEQYENNQVNKQPEQFTSLLLEKEERIDKNGKEFLVLTCENGRKLYCFSSLINVIR